MSSTEPHPELGAPVFATEPPKSTTSAWALAFAGSVAVVLLLVSFDVLSFDRPASFAWPGVIVLLLGVTALRASRAPTTPVLRVFEAGFELAGKTVRFADLSSIDLGRPLSRAERESVAFLAIGGTVRSGLRTGARAIEDQAAASLTCDLRSGTTVVIRNALNTITPRDAVALFDAIEARCPDAVIPGSPLAELLAAIRAEAA